MTSQVSRRISSLSQEIASKKAQLGRLRDRLDVQRVLLDEYRLRMLIAETPLADRDLQVAAEGFLEIEREVRTLESSIETLRLEEQRLAGGLAAAGA